MCMMSDGQMSTHSPQPSQRVIYTKVGIRYSSISYRKLVRTALVMVGAFGLDAAAHVGRILAHVHRHVRELAMHFGIGQVVVGRQVLAAAVGHDDALLERGSGLEEHVRELGP